MSEEINEIFEQWKQFLSWCYESNDKTTEIHRDNLERVMAYTRQLENIIKKVREYLNKNEIEEVYLDCKLYETEVYKDILEILDKGSEKE